jgi:hypothetical protein
MGPEKTTDKRALINWKVFAHPFILFLSALLLFLILSAPPLQLKEPLRHYSDSANCTSSKSGDPRDPGPLQEDRRLIMGEEIKKANEEIRMRLDQEDQWYHYKFLIVGGVLAAFIGRFAIGRKDRKDSEEQLEDLLRSNATCLAMALACVLAFAVDIHIRNNMTVTNQLGNWLAYYAEPTLQHSCFQSSMDSGPLLLWENFLRVDRGMHVSLLYSFTFWPHLHFLTAVLYLIYLAIFHRAIRDARTKDPRLTLAGFVLVHISIGVFAWVAHTAPENFEFVMPIRSLPISGWKAPALYLVPVLVLALLNFRRSRSPGQREEPAQAAVQSG